MVALNNPLFNLGQVVATPGALEALEKAGQTPAEFLDRHIRGDWGEVDAEDRQANEEARKNGGRILSAYTKRPANEFGSSPNTIEARRVSCCRRSINA